MIHVTSLTCSSSFHWAVRKRPRRRIGKAWRRKVSLRTNAVRARPSSPISGHSSQLISLSWQYALLLPRWVWPNSSPASIIGVPRDRIRVASMLRFCRSRSARIAGSSVGPSTPWLNERLFELPSRLSSPLASLCLSL